MYAWAECLQHRKDSIKEFYRYERLTVKTYDSSFSCLRRYSDSLSLDPKHHEYIDYNVADHVLLGNIQSLASSA